MTKKYKEIDEALAERIQSKIEWEGLDYYLSEGGWAVEDFEGTELEEPLAAYIDARAELIHLLSAAGIDV